MSSITLCIFYRGNEIPLWERFPTATKNVLMLFFLTIVTSDIGLDYEIKSYTTIKKYIFQGLNHV